MLRHERGPHVGSPEADAELHEAPELTHAESPALDPPCDLVCASPFEPLGVAHELHQRAVGRERGDEVAHERDFAVHELVAVAVPAPEESLPEPERVFLEALEALRSRRAVAEERLLDPTFRLLSDVAKMRRV